MEVSNVCALQSAELDAKTNISSSLNAASVTDSETVINSKTDSTLVKEQKSDEELLDGLLTEYYCHVCSSNLLFESNRLAHYEGTEHTQRVKTYLNAVRAELARGCQRSIYYPVSAKEKHLPLSDAVIAMFHSRDDVFRAMCSNMPRDKNRFCELCNMVFSSPVVAKSHYEGKIHTKNLREKSLPIPVKETAVHNSPAITQDPFYSNQNSSQEDDLELHPDPTPTSNIPDLSTCFGVDIKDPDKYCALCVAFFNNPQMALQHYKGRKHQRKKARLELLNELGKDSQQGNSIMCQMCGVSVNSVEMYQAHMQGNKHQIREKKLRDLFKSQPKVYSTFADELADYIQVQKARGITPKTSQVLPEDSTQNDDEGKEEEVQSKDINQCDLTPTPISQPNLSEIPHHPPPPLPQPIPGTWFPFYPVPSWTPFGWPYSLPPPLLPCPSSTQLTSWPTDTGQQRRLSTSSSCTTSSSSHSSRSSDTSDSDECEHSNIEKRKTKKHREDRKGDKSYTEERRRKRPRMERGYDSDERRREPFVESGEEWRRKKLKSHRKRTQKEKACQQENFEVERDVSTTDKLPSQAKNNNHERSETGHSKSAKTRREKKKTKDVVDSRTEEEKLWDDSILGC